jgi:cytochrome c oxidase assembly protein subunit 15
MLPAPFRRLAVFTLVFTLAVIVWGAWVRASRSGDGCGEHWPVCNGQVIPLNPSARTVVEFTHRVTSGVDALLAVAVYVVARRVVSRGHPARRAAGWAVGFMVTEALLGAVLVKAALVGDNATANRAAAMCVHLMNTFLLLAAMAVTVVGAFAGEQGVRRLQLRSWPFAAMAAVMLVGVSGATAALGDTLVQQAVINDLVEVLIRLRILHPLLALGAGALVVLTVVRSRPPWALGSWLTALVVLQLVAGLVNVILQAPGWMQLVHLLLADLVWVTLTALAFAAPQVKAP